MSVHQLHRRLPLVGLAVAAPTAAARPALDGPLTPPAATVGGVDVRTPDARDAADHRGVYEPRAATVGGVDLRMPDTRDAADHYDPAYVAAPAPAPSADDDGGFDWGSAGIGAGSAVAGLGALGFAGLTLGRRRRTALPRRPVRTE